MRPPKTAQNSLEYAIDRQTERLFGGISRVLATEFIDGDWKRSHYGRSRLPA